MRIALVSPYSWTYAGGVNFHVEALAEEFLRRGDHVRVLAPWDPPGRLSRVLHRADPVVRDVPDYLIPLGRTVGFPANGAVSNLCVFPSSVTKMRRELRQGRFDVVHVHEPVAPLIGWDALGVGAAPAVGTFHAYSTKAFPNQMANLIGARRVLNKLHARIAVSEAAAWTGQRWFGGDYTVIPNGVDLDAAPAEAKPVSDGLRLIFVGRPEERKGLPVLLAAFGALVEHVPARLTVIGADPPQVERLLSDPEVARFVDCPGRVERDELWRRLHEADILCAPSLAGESFGMVLTEAFAAGTPVVASGIAGYNDVVQDGIDGILVPPGDPQSLAETLQALHHDRPRLAALTGAARSSAVRYGWPRVADKVSEVYEQIQHVPAPVGGSARAARRLGLVPADGKPRVPARRLPSLDPDPVGPSVGRRAAKAIGLGVATVGGAGLTALAVERVGLDHVVESFVRSSPSWVLIGFVLMVASMLLRAISWHAIASAALPGRIVKRRDIASGTMIGVLMSATLPARLGEPARALVVSRRVGRMRETFPVLIGTLVSQTLLNVLALVLLGAIIVSTTDLFHRKQEAVFIFSAVPVVLALAVLLAPMLVRGRNRGLVGRMFVAAREALLRVRSGLTVFRQPRRASIATGAQLGAWGLQLISCYVLIIAMGLDGHAGIGAAAAALFAVNVTAVVPVTPSNIGVFQIAVISVLTTGYGVSAADALAYGIVLQAVEIATAIALGVPALVREGLTWSDMRLRALGAAPVRLAPIGSEPSATRDVA